MSTHFYESFNARNYTPAQVAETFIPNDDYDQLWRNEHTVVLGPRGSGKTTLFKMLTTQGLYSWSHPMADMLRKSRLFTAIYVPTDMHWHHQLRHAEELLRDAPRFNQASSRAAVTTSVLLAVTRTFQDRLKYEFHDRYTSETDLCLKLIAEWRLPKMLPCLDLVVLALKSRISEIRSIINEAVSKASVDTSLANVPGYFHLDYFAAMDVACSSFDYIFGLSQTNKWALCFDELELAPQWLQSLAFSQQRSTEEKYLIKLSTSPLPSLLGVTEARPKQDVRLLCIWNHPGRRSDDFAEKLAVSVLKQKLGQDIPPRSLFGNSDLILESEQGVEKYERGSAEWRLIKEVASWDASLRTILTRSGIDPNDPFTTNIAIRDKLLRKIKPVATLRRAFLKPTGSGSISLRSRKLSTIYYGCEAIYRISDGNPRRLIGIIGDLCSRLRKNKEGAYMRLMVNDQAEILSRASLHFFGYVHVLPGGITSLGVTILISQLF